MVIGRNTTGSGIYCTNLVYNFRVFIIRIYNSTDSPILPVIINIEVTIDKLWIIPVVLIHSLLREPTSKCVDIKRHRSSLIVYARVFGSASAQISPIRATRSRLILFQCHAALIRDHILTHICGRRYIYILCSNKAFVGIFCLNQKRLKNFFLSIAKPVLIGVDIYIPLQLFLYILYLLAQYIKAPDLCYTILYASITWNLLIYGFFIIHIYCIRYPVQRFINNELIIKATYNICKRFGG